MEKEKIIWNHDILKLIRDARSTKHSDRIVLSALAIRVNPRKRHSCWPGQPLLVIDTQLDLKTVRAALDRLEANGLIARKKRFDDTDVYWINVALLQRQAAANKAMKDELPECPFDEPTMEQEQQLDADEAKVIFDEGPASDPTPAEEPAAVEPSPISAAIQRLKYVNEKMTVKDADRMAASLMKSHKEEDVLQAIASLDEYGLREAYKAKNPIGYLRQSINNALSALENSELASDDSRTSDALVDANDEIEDDDPNIYFDERPDDATIASCLEAIPEGQVRYFHANDPVTNAQKLEAQVRRVADARRFKVGELYCGPKTTWCFAVDRLISATRARCSTPKLGMKLRGSR